MSDSSTAKDSNSNFGNKTFEQVISPNNIRLDQVVNSLKAFKKAIYNVNYLANALNTNSDKITDPKDYYNVLKPIAEKDYYNNTDDFWIYSINNYSKRICYINWQKYSFWSGLNGIQMELYNNKNGLSKYNLYLRQQYIKHTNSFNRLSKKYPKNTILYALDVNVWSNGLKIFFLEFRKDLLDSTKWIQMTSGIDLEPFIPNTNDLSKFSSQYMQLINDLQNEIEILNGNDWETDATWPYADPGQFDKLFCLESSQYPEWTNLPISQCFIPGSNVDVPTTIYGIMVDLFFNYPTLLPGQVAISTYSLGDLYYVAFLKIDMYNGELCFKQKSIEINKYFTISSLAITNDGTINGSLNIKTYDGEDVIKTDNITKTTAFHTKIGVNQDLSKVKGLIDVDNLSNNSVLNMMNDFVNPLLYSYEVTMDIKDKLSYGATSVSIPLTYQENVFVFKTLIQNVIHESDIKFLYVPAVTGIFKTNAFDSTSFTKIQTIVNELNKMQTEMDLNEDTMSFLFSFVELLSDTNNYYLCSLRGVVKRNPNHLTKEIYFICSFLNVHDKIINRNYKPYMVALTDKFSSCSRLLNFSNLLVLDTKIQDNLFQGQSISNSTDPNSNYFSDRINNSYYFRDRFGGKDLYVYCNEYLTNEELLIVDSNVELFCELLPYYNNKQSKTLFKPNTDTSIFTLTKICSEQFNNLYGPHKSALSFSINYDWIKGRKISFENMIIIKGNKYIIGCGINLSDVLDETIVAKGDNKITGNLTIMDDTTNVPVFDVNREKKQTSSVYMTGIGKTNPQTMLDVNDCGVTDIINVINQMATKYNLLNYNSPGFIEAFAESETSAFQYFENNFIDPATGKELVQDINSYLFVVQTPNNLYPKDTKYIYHGLKPYYRNNTLQQLLDKSKNDKQVINFAINYEEKKNNNNNFFNLSSVIVVYNWMAGIKIATTKNIIVDGKNYTIGTGVNLQQYLTYESNDNIQKFFACLQSYNFQLQDIVIRYQIQNNNPISPILNQQKAADVRYQYAQQYPIQKLFQYTIDFNNIQNMTISSFDYNALTVSNTQTYSEIMDASLITKLMFLFINLKNKYTLIRKDDYGVISFEDQYDDFLSLFWCSSVSGNTVTLISLELQINTIIIPSLQLKGDMKIQGDTYFCNGTTSTNKDIYALIDTDKKFFGINTVQTVSNYANNYATTTNGSFAKNNVYITSNTYPNTIIERIEETEKPSTSNYHKFKNYSTLSVRRNSNLYTFEEMYKYSKRYTSTNAPGLINCYGSVKNKYYYGADIAYEIQDITNIVKEIGNIHIGIDKIETNDVDGSTIVRGGFGVSLVDPLPSGNVQQREILHVDNNSQMYVNSIMLGGKLLQVDVSGNLLFDGKKVTLN